VEGLLYLEQTEAIKIWKGPRTKNKRRARNKGYKTDAFLPKNRSSLYIYIYNPLSTHTHNNNKKMDPKKKFMGISLFLLQFQGTKTPFSPFSLFTVWNQKKKEKEKKIFSSP